MRTPRRQSVQRYHDRVAHRYDDIYDDAHWHWHDALTWDYIKPHLPRNLDAKIADLGCGTGKWAEKLIHSGYHVTCVDISQEMLDQARSKIEHDAPPEGKNDQSPSRERRTSDQSRDRQEAVGDQSRERERPVPADGDAASDFNRGRARKAEFIRADLCDLSMIESESFSLALALGEPICCTSSPARAIKEIHHILADDGLLIATFDNRFAAIDYYLEQGDADDLQKFLRDGVTHWLTKDKGERFPLHTFSPSDIVKLLEKAGFQVVEMLGKTVLPMRKFRHLLEESNARRTWAAIEKSLARDAGAIGRAPHIQVTCRRRSGKP